MMAAPRDTSASGRDSLDHKELEQQALVEIRRIRTVEHRDSSADGKQRKRVRQFHGQSARRWSGDGLLLHSRHPTIAIISSTA